MSQLSGWDKEESPYHKGEQALHDRLGIKERQEDIARRIHRPFMPEQHRSFFNQLPFIIAASVDQQGWPWASILFGDDGFITSATNRKLSLQITPMVGDVFIDNAQAGSPVGFVGLELHTRRRNRLNGVVSKNVGDRVEVDVVQSFGNCPQYIQTRSLERVAKQSNLTKTTVKECKGLDEQAIELISKADTFFVSSINDQDDIRVNGGVDVNHRGGQPGFVKVDGNVLTIPDYIGNFAFNTLGNFLVNPKAGLLFIDFDTGDILQAIGIAEVLWDKTQEIEAFKGAERSWTFTVERCVCLKSASPLRWRFGEFSPNVKFTGNWIETKNKLALLEKRDAWQRFKVVRMIDESSIIRSFYLEPLDDTAILFNYQPGQFVPIRIKNKASGKSIVRTYTLSSADSDNLYRISVKREGASTALQGEMSSYLHTQVKPGDLFEVKAPRGDFTFDTQGKTPAVLIAGGVGITPMIAMVRAAIADKVRYRYLRPITIVHLARTASERAFKKEFERIELASDGLVRYFSVVSQPQITPQTPLDSHYTGRLSRDMLKEILPLDNYAFFLCGPDGFMQAAYDIARNLGINDDKIFAESFGPSSLVRSSVNNDVQAIVQESESAIITFTASKFEQAWTKGDGTLLEFAEKHGLNPSFSCRNGMCGSCAVKVNGNIAYKTKPNYITKKGDVLICCAVPAKGTDKIDIAL